MKFIKCFITSILISFTLGNQVYADQNDNSIISETPIFEAANITLNGQGADVTRQVGHKFQGNDFTAVITYNQTKNSGIQALFGISNSKVGNQNSYLDVFIRDNGELGMEARDTSSNTNNLVSRPASVWGKYKNQPVSNTIA
ncbi:hypothetical protein P9698_002951, partial [Enterococcus faecalis]|nr:hypothetical protein [Enterococcus faecalis]